MNHRIKGTVKIRGQQSHGCEKKISEEMLIANCLTVNITRYSTLELVRGHTNGGVAWTAELMAAWSRLSVCNGDAMLISQSSDYYWYSAATNFDFGKHPAQADAFAVNCGGIIGLKSVFVTPLWPEERLHKMAAVQQVRYGGLGLPDCSIGILP